MTGGNGQVTTASKMSINSVLQCDNPYEELAVVTAEVETVTEHLTRLIDRLHVLNECANQQYSPFIRLLPPEIIVQIFIFCLPPFSPVKDSPPSSRDTSIPLRIGAVCSALRRIAWSTPSLWATLTFHLTSSLKLATQTTLLQEWLSRSGQLPLSIRLTCSEEVCRVNTSPDGVINAISQYASRWRHVDLRLPSRCYTCLPTCEEAEDFPLLESLSLKPPFGHGDRAHEIKILTSPHLRYLSLSCLYLRSVTFHYDVLTHIELESFYIDETLEILHQAAALVCLTARKVLQGHERYTIPEEPLILPCLEEIDIVNNTGTDLRVLFAKITAPKLQILRSTGNNFVPASIAEVVGLVKRSGCQLQTLEISKTPIREEPLQTLLAAIPSLTSLSLIMPVFTTLRHAPLTDAVLQTLDPSWAQSNKVECSLPHLTNLTYSGAQGFTWPTILRVLESRLPKSSSSKQSLISAEGSSGNKISFIRVVELSLAFMTPEENSAYPRPDQFAFDCLGSRGTVVTNNTIIRTEAVFEPTV